MRTSASAFSLFVSSFVAGGAHAQSAPLPLTTEKAVEGHIAEGQAPDAVCYAINPPAGSSFTVTARSKDFDSDLKIGRGALCSSAAVQVRNDEVEGDDRPAELTAKSAGGRYLVFVNPKDPSAFGQFTLTLRTEADGQAATPPATTAEARALRMAQEDAAYRKQQADAKAAADVLKARQREVEQIRMAEEQEQLRQEQEYAQFLQMQQAARPQQNFLNTFTSAFNEEYAKSQQQQANQQAFLNELQAQANEIERQRRQAEMQAAQQRMAEANQRSRMAAAEAELRQREQQARLETDRATALTGQNRDTAMDASLPGAHASAQPGPGVANAQSARPAAVRTGPVSWVGTCPMSAPAVGEAYSSFVGCTTVDGVSVSFAT